MRALLQRVASASVVVDSQTVGTISRGLLVLVGIHKDDTVQEGRWLAGKLLQARLFDDPAGKMNLSVTDIAGEILVISQFTLYGDLGAGNRPSYSDAMPRDKAKRLWEEWVAMLRGITPLRVQQGVFAASMQVSLVNDGPVTVMIDSRE